MAALKSFAEVQVKDKLLQKFDFNDIVISIKSSHVAAMKKASEIVAQKCDYPLHIGVTESGRGEDGLIKSAVPLKVQKTATQGQSARKH